MKIPYNSSNSFVRNIFLLKDECPFDLYTVTFTYIFKKKYRICIVLSVTS